MGICLNSRTLCVSAAVCTHMFRYYSRLLRWVRRSLYDVQFIVVYTTSATPTKKNKALTASRAYQRAWTIAPPGECNRTYHVGLYGVCCETWSCHNRFCTTCESRVRTYPKPTMMANISHILNSKNLGKFVSKSNRRGNSL